MAAGALPWARLLAASAPASPLKRLGAAEPFDYAQLKGLARSMAGTAYKPPDVVLPAPIAKLGGEEAVKRFIELANERGGKDNITAILVEID